MVRGNAAVPSRLRSGKVAPNGQCCQHAKLTRRNRGKNTLSNRPASLACGGGSVDPDEQQRSEREVARRMSWTRRRLATVC